MIDNAAEEKGWSRLRPDFRDKFDWTGSSKLCRAFAHWARTERQPPIRVDIQHSWRPFRDGEPVSLSMVEAFSEYITDVLKRGSYPLLAMAEPSAPPQVAKGAEREPDLWGHGWAGVFSYFAKNFSPPEEAYCRDEDDLMMASRMVIRHVGEAMKPSLRGEAAIAHGERHIGVTVDAYAAYLLKLWKANDSSILFATLARGAAQVRVGCIVSAAVTDEFYYRFRAGKLEDSDMTDADILPEGLNILIAAAAENKAMGHSADQSVSQRLPDPRWHVPVRGAGTHPLQAGCRPAAPVVSRHPRERRTPEVVQLPRDQRVDKSFRCPGDGVCPSLAVDPRPLLPHRLR